MKTKKTKEQLEKEKLELELDEIMMLEFKLNDVIKQANKIKRYLKRKMRNQKFTSLNASIVSILLGHMDRDMSGAVVAGAMLNAATAANDGYPKYMGSAREVKKWRKKGNKIRIFEIGRGEKFVHITYKHGDIEKTERIFRLAPPNSGTQEELVVRLMVEQGILEAEPKRVVKGFAKSLGTMLRAN